MIRRRFMLILFMEILIVSQGVASADPLPVDVLTRMVNKIRDALRPLDKDCFKLRTQRDAAKWFKEEDKGRTFSAEKPFFGGFKSAQFVDHWGKRSLLFGDWPLKTDEVARILASLRSLLLTIRSGSTQFFTYVYDFENVPPGAGDHQWLKHWEAPYQKDPTFPEQYNDPDDHCGDRVTKWLKMPEWEAVRQMYPNHYVDEQTEHQVQLPIQRIPLENVPGITAGVLLLIAGAAYVASAPISVPATALATGFILLVSSGPRTNQKMICRPMNGKTVRQFQCSEI